MWSIWRLEGVAPQSPNTNVRGPPRASGCQFLELCHYKDSRTASHMWTVLLNWVHVCTCKHQNLPTQPHFHTGTLFSRQDSAADSTICVSFLTPTVRLSPGQKTRQGTSPVPEPPQIFVGQPQGHKAFSSNTHWTNSTSHRTSSSIPRTFARTPLLRHVQNLLKDTDPT